MLDFIKKLPSFMQTRARNTDGDTSHAAAKHAASNVCNLERKCIHSALVMGGDMTAKEIAKVTHIDYIEVQRRLSETSGICRTEKRRDGCVVWTAKA